MTEIREATEADWAKVWALFRGVAARGDVFAYDESTTEETARKLWFEPLPVSPDRADCGGPQPAGRAAVCFVCEIDGEFAGTYYVRPNQPGRGAHVANAGYMVVPEFRGRGLSVAMCLHSLETARRLGFRAMQFNFVVSTNAAAIRAWERCGFAVVGRIPGAFRHKELGNVDALVMHREL